MKSVLFISLFLLSSTMLSADDSIIKCNPDGNQMELNRCAQDDFEKADSELNETYQALMKASVDNKAYMKELRESQRIWIEFRDAELEAMFACDEVNMRVCWGSMLGILYPAAKTELTVERTNRLKRYLEKGQNNSVGEVN